MNKYKIAFWLVLLIVIAHLTLRVPSSSSFDNTQGLGFFDDLSNNSLCTFVIDLFYPSALYAL